MRIEDGIARFALFGDALEPVAPEFLHVETISSRSSQHDWTISSHFHPELFQLLLLERGGVGLMLDDAVTRLEPTTLVIVPMGCVHGYTFDPGSEGWVVSIAAPLLHDRRIAALLEGGTLERELPGTARLETEPAAQRLSQLLGDLAQDEMGTPAEALSRTRAATLALILTMADALLTAHGSGAPAGSPHGGLVSRFRRLVEQHFREGWGVARYASQLGTTVPTLTRACRGLLLKAPAEFVHDRIMLEAMRLLIHTPSSVSQIAVSLGFDDPAYFARFFKRRSGLTSGEFRRRGGR